MTRAAMHSPTIVARDALVVLSSTTSRAPFDAALESVAIVDERVARIVFGSADAIGQTLVIDKTL